MAVEPLFIDSGGFYALISRESDTHQASVLIMEAAAAHPRAQELRQVLDCGGWGARAHAALALHARIITNPAPVRNHRSPKRDPS